MFSLLKHVPSRRHGVVAGCLTPPRTVNYMRRVGRPHLQFLWLKLFCEGHSCVSEQRLDHSLRKALKPWIRPKVPSKPEAPLSTLRAFFFSGVLPHLSSVAGGSEEASDSFRPWRLPSCRRHRRRCKRQCRPSTWWDPRQCSRRFGGFESSEGSLKGAFVFGGLLHEPGVRLRS